jgi:hypothetical protein
MNHSLNQSIYQSINLSINKEMNKGTKEQRLDKERIKYSTNRIGD